MKTRALFFVLAFVAAGALFVLQPAKPASANGGVHCVRYGETLFSLGRYYGVSPYAIARYNGIANPNYIRAGSCLSIPAHGYHQPAPKHPGHHQPAPKPPAYHGGYQHHGSPSWHQVKYGETVYSIARWYGISPYYLAKTNGLYNANYIRAGQLLYIPAH